MTELLAEVQASDASHIMRTPRTVDIDLTAHCNLRCRYCYFFNNSAVTYEDLPTAEWLRFFDELGRLAVMDVNLAGGEPFIREDLPELLQGVVRNRMRFALLSNGGLIDDTIADTIARSGRCKYVQISVDGASPAAHDAARGKGSFEGAMRGLRILRQHGVQVAVRVTIHRHNFNELEAIAKLLLEELDLASFGINSAGYLGNCRVNADDIHADHHRAHGRHAGAGAPVPEVPRPHPGYSWPVGRCTYVAEHGRCSHQGSAALPQWGSPHRLRVL